MTDAPTEMDETFACDLNALTPQERDHHVALAQTLFGSLVDARELENGYALRLPDAPDTLATVADFIAHDRRCCPFFSFGVEVGAHGGPIWLRITGARGVKQAFVAELGDLVPDAIASAAGMR